MEKEKNRTKSRIRSSKVTDFGVQGTVVHLWSWNPNLDFHQMILSTQNMLPAKKRRKASVHFWCHSWVWICPHEFGRKHRNRHLQEWRHKLKMLRNVTNATSMFMYVTSLIAWRYLRVYNGKRCRSLDFVNWRFWQNAAAKVSLSDRKGLHLLCEHPREHGRSRGWHRVRRSWGFGPCWSCTRNSSVATCQWRWGDNCSRRDHCDWRNSRCPADSSISRKELLSSIYRSRNYSVCQRYSPVYCWMRRHHSSRRDHCD